ncbi:hypothetical protein DPMN_137311 [Dreissena polymorpha]|uniref:Uncharacterized protein n=1 Tax=Dreissena polymorpha TaxID=45954 RepID=A0A9D4G4H7_DREPO|nr:hypothetical protein DPMN_137311 [Dreissena polymorpha]
MISNLAHDHNVILINNLCVWFSFVNNTSYCQFKCKTSKECVDKNLVCDGKAVCRYKSDESDCITCFDMLTCRNGQCINKNGVCDGLKQCNDGSDEIGCHGIKAKLAIILLVVAGLVCIIMLCIIIAVCCRFYNSRNSGYKPLA